MPKRNNLIREIRPVFHIFCEGEKTEPYYIQHYLDKHCGSYSKLCELKVCRDSYLLMEETSKNTPVQLVETAVEKKRKCPPIDVFWVVYDRESVNKYSDALHQQAYDRACGSDVHIALSNVCFEQWLLLHRVYSTKAYNSYDDLYEHSELKKRFPGYKKGDSSTYSVTEEEVRAARRNAVKINANSRAAAERENELPFRLNPYTDMHLLLDSVDAFLQREKEYRLLRIKEQGGA